MTATVPFNDVLESAGRLPPEDQQALIDILRRQLADAGRARVAAEVEDARREFAAGRCRPTTPDDLMREIGEAW